MRRVECPKLCDDCPIRENIEGEPAVLREISYSAEAAISEDRKIASIDLYRGMPVGERTSTIGIANSADKIGAAFDIAGSAWDRGEVESAIECCDGPIEERKGFFNLRKSLACWAIGPLNK